MKRLALFAVTILLLCSALAHGQQVSLDHVLGLMGTDTLLTNRPITFYIRFTQDYPEYIWGSTNGFVLKSSDGAVWAPATVEPAGAITEDMYDGGIFVNFASWDGMGADTVGFGGFKVFNLGIPTGFDEIVLTLETFFEESQNGKHFALDTTFYMPAGAWLWSSVESFEPAWDGPHEYVIWEPCCGEFVWENCPAELSFHHCDTAVFDFDAHSLSPEQQQQPVTYRIIEGPGTIDSVTGVWTCLPTSYLGPQSTDLIIGIYDEFIPGPACQVDKFR